jgi:O-antigen ligase
VLLLETDTSRLISTESNRAGTWGQAIDLYLDSSIVLGTGWVSNARFRGLDFLSGGILDQRANLHSMYIQTLVETGLLGVMVMLGCTMQIASAGMQVRRFFWRVRVTPLLARLPLVLLVGILLLGVAESGPIMGSTPDTILLGFAIGLIDRLPQLAIADRGISHRSRARA